jgi:hypothetical protein
MPVIEAQCASILVPHDHRHINHLSPEMTMRYAATLASTAEREFLAMVKIGRDGREIGMDRRDMLDVVQLDQRTDRILPNGYCLLPPVRSCDKGNAPLTEPTTMFQQFIACFRASALTCPRDRIR